MLEHGHENTLHKDEPKSRNGVLHLSPNAQHIRINLGAQIHATKYVNSSNNKMKAGGANLPGRHVS
jgi:hypothetical protein